MGLKRARLVDGNSVPKAASMGDGIFMPSVTLPGDAAVTLTVAQMLMGAIYGVVTTGRAYTTPTAALLTAALPTMNNGDTFGFWLVSTGGAVTLTGGTGVTVTGGVMVDGVGAFCIVTKTSDTAYTIHCF